MIIIIIKNTFFKEMYWVSFNLLMESHFDVHKRSKNVERIICIPAKVMKKCDCLIQIESFPTEYGNLTCFKLSLSYSLCMKKIQQKFIFN